MAGQTLQNLNKGYKMNKQEMQRKKDDIPKITFEQAITQLTLSWNTRNPMLLVGPPATAKTAVTKQFAAINDFDVIVTTGATSLPTDVKGNANRL